MLLWTAIAVAMQQYIAFNYNSCRRPTCSTVRSVVCCLWLLLVTMLSISNQNSLGDSFEQTLFSSSLTAFLYWGLGLILNLACCCCGWLAVCCRCLFVVLFVVFMLFVCSVSVCYYHFLLIRSRIVVLSVVYVYVWFVVVVIIVFLCVCGLICLHFFCNGNSSFFVVVRVVE